jgi:uncharacterized membrane protein (Fun14 family)
MSIGEPAEAGMATWKKLLVALSLLLMAGGAGGKVYGRFSAGPAKPSAAPTGGAPAPATLPPGSKGFVSGQAPAAPNAAPAPAAPAVSDSRIDWDRWSPALFRGGFSFFAGFCIAYALRTVLKVGLLVCGVVLIAMFALQYAGLLNIDWNSISGQYDSVAAWLKGQFGNFKDFVSGHLPSAGSAVAGLAIGFMR